MNPENSHILEPTHFRSRSSPFHPQLDNSISQSPPENNPKLGSTLPKLTKFYIPAAKSIKPPSLILANPFLKAAKKIDQQTASIPWNDFSNTLKQSKSNFARMKEIYWPVRSDKFLNLEEKKNLRKKKFSKISQVEKSCQNIAVNTIFESSSMTGKNWTCVKLKNFCGLDENKFQYCENGEDKGRVDKDKDKDRGRAGEGDGRYSMNVMVRKFLVKRKEVDESLPSTSEGCSEGVGTAPFAVVLRGNKVRSSVGNRFIPVSSGVFTPNHFMRKGES